MPYKIQVIIKVKLMQGSNFLLLYDIFHYYDSTIEIKMYIYGTFPYVFGRDKFCGL